MVLWFDSHNLAHLIIEDVTINVRPEDTQSFITS